MQATGETGFKQRRFNSSFLNNQDVTSLISLLSTRGQRESAQNIPLDRLQGGISSGSLIIS